MDKTWADDLTIFEALDIVGQVQKAVDSGQLGTAAKLLRVPADFAGSGEELNDVCQIRFRALVNRLLKDTDETIGGK